MAMKTEAALRRGRRARRDVSEEVQYHFAADLDHLDVAFVLPWRERRVRGPATRAAGEIELSDETTTVTDSAVLVAAGEVLPR